MRRPVARRRRREAASTGPAVPALRRPVVPVEASSSSPQATSSDGDEGGEGDERAPADHGVSWTMGSATVLIANVTRGDVAPHGGRHVTRAAPVRMRWETCQRSATRSITDSTPRNTTPSADGGQDRRPEDVGVLVGGPAPGRTEPGGGEVAALAVVRRGERQADVVAGGGEDRRQRRRQAQATQHLEPAGVDGGQELAGRRVGRPHAGDGGEHERRRGHERDQEDHRAGRRARATRRST